MAVTKSWESKVLAVGSEGRVSSGRAGWRQFLWLACASLLVSAGLLLVYSAKTHDFGELSSRMSRAELLNLNQITSADELLPVLQVYPSDAERGFVARQAFEFVRAHRPGSPRRDRASRFLRRLADRIR